MRPDAREKKTAFSLFADHSAACCGTGFGIVFASCASISATSCGFTR
jgi:hypothetical protein